MAISVIIPAYNAATDLRECLAALAVCRESVDEILVADDASTDDTAAAAVAGGARVVRHDRNRGPAAARNLGAAHADGDILFFVDADVAVASDAVGRVKQLFRANPEVAAVFGSYDTRPRAPGVVSQYRNLLHHYVHQHGSTEAFTFWAGCGAVRRDAFVAVGGFDDRSAWHFIEDIELGYRLRRAGYRVHLDKELRATHLKRWTLTGVLRTDTLFRAAPWTRLIRQTAMVQADLNLTRTQRLSVMLAGVVAVCLPLAAVNRTSAFVAALTIASLVVLNRTLYRFFYRERGFFFALACVPLHVLYFLCSGAGFMYGLLTPAGQSESMRLPNE